MKPLLLSAMAIIGLAGVSFAEDVDIAVTELPKPVTASISKQFPQSTLVSAEKDLAGDGAIQHYEVKVRVDNALKELTVLPNGTITKTEKDD